MRAKNQSQSDANETKSDSSVYAALESCCKAPENRGSN